MGPSPRVAGRSPSCYLPPRTTPRWFVLRSIGKYTCGTHNPGFISGHVGGKTIECLLIDGTWLIIRTTDGHEFKIGWQDSSGNQVQGEPFLENLDARIIVPGAQIGG